MTFEPVYHQHIWGGERIKKAFDRPRAPMRSSESWEVADREEGMSLVANGPFKGRALGEIVQQYGEALLGQGCNNDRFPLLIKIIDASEPLSIQVHPSEESAPAVQGEPKTEMWYLLEGGPVYASFKKPVTPEAFARAVKDKSVADLLQKVDAKPGDAIFIPGGRMHAIGPGCLIFEVQQNSNTTYRVYDWDRVDSQGKRRPLHLEQALQCTQWNDDQDPSVLPILLVDDGISKQWRVLSTPFFTVERLEITDHYRISPNPKTYQIIFHLSGKRKGECCLLPAVSEPLDLEGPAHVLRIFSRSIKELS